MDNSIKLLRVSSKSKPNSVAGAIAGMIRSENKVQIQTIGAGALNQAIKGKTSTVARPVNIHLILRANPLFLTNQLVIALSRGSVKAILTPVPARTPQTT